MDPDDEPGSLSFAWNSDTDNPDSGVCAVCAVSSHRRAAPGGSSPLCFRERRRHATHPHHHLGPDRGHALTNGSIVGDGGGILNHGAVTFTSSSLSGNSATGNGGGLANVDTPSGTAPAATFTRSPVSNNTALLSGGGIYNGLRATLTTNGVSGSPMVISGNSATQRGGGIAAVGSTATTLTQTAVTTNNAVLDAGGVYRQGGTMTTTNSPISANTVNNCLGSVPAVPTCTG